MPAQPTIINRNPANGIMVLNTPTNPMPANPGLPVVTMPPGTPGLPQGGTVQAHPTIPNAIVHVTPPSSQATTPTQQKLNQPGNKFPYAPNAVYQYDIVVTRLTHAITGTLPFVIGIGDEFQNGFSDFLPLVTGAALTVPNSVAFTSGGALNFVYVDSSSNTDTVQITCAQTPYSRLLKMWETHRFKATQARVSLSDTTALAQFNASIKTGNINEDSETRTKPLSFVANDSPYQFQGYKIDLARNVYMSKVEGILAGIINDSINNFAVTFSLFIQESAPTWTGTGDTSSYTTASSAA